MSSWWSTLWSSQQTSNSTRTTGLREIPPNEQRDFNGLDRITTPPVAIPENHPLTKEVKLRNSFSTSSLQSLNSSQRVIPSPHTPFATPNVGMNVNVQQNHEPIPNFAPLLTTFNKLPTANSSTLSSEDEFVNFIHLYFILSTYPPFSISFLFFFLFPSFFLFHSFFSFSFLRKCTESTKPPEWFAAASRWRSMVTGDRQDLTVNEEEFVILLGKITFTLEVPTSSLYLNYIILISLCFLDL
jgi:hypothetical protein